MAGIKNWAKVTFQDGEGKFLYSKWVKWVKFLYHGLIFTSNLFFFNFMKKGHLTVVCEICEEPNLYLSKST